MNSRSLEAARSGETRVAPERLRPWLLTGLFLLVLVFQLSVQVWAGSTLPRLLLSLASAAVLAVSLTCGDVGERLLPLGLLALGGALLTYRGVPARQWLPGFSYMASMAVLVVVAPVIQLLFARRGYSAALAGTVSLHTDLRVVTWSTLLNHVLGSVVLLGSFPLVYEMMRDQERRMGRDRFIDVVSRTMVRGFSSVVLWSPVSPTVSVALAFAGLRWTDVLPIALALTLGSVGASLVAEVLRLYLRYETTQWVSEFILKRYRCQGGIAGKPYGSEPAASNSSGGDLAEPSELGASGHVEPRKRAVELSCLLSFFILSVLALEHATGWPVIVLVPLITVAITSLGFVVTGERGLTEDIRRFFGRQIPEKVGDLRLFFATGFAAYGLKESGLMEAALKWIYQTAPGETSVAVFILPASILLACFGIPPLAAGALITASLDPSHLALPPRLLVAAVCAGVSVGVLVSPVSGAVMSCSALTQQDPYRVGLKANWAFALVVFAVMEAFLQIAAK